MNILVTGSSGFVGKELYDFLNENKKYNVYGTKRKNTSNNNKFLELDLLKPFNFSLTNIDIVVHTAAKTHSYEDCKNYFKSDFFALNEKATIRLAIKAIRENVKKFIFISTVKVLGEDTVLGKPFNKNSIPNPKNNYSLSKLRSENKLLKLSKKFNIDLIIIRPPVIYGERVKGNFSIIMKFLKFYIPFPLTAFNFNKRSVLSIKNLVSFIDYSIENISKEYGNFLISDNKDLSTIEIITLLSKLTKRYPIFFFLPRNFVKFLLIFFNKRRIYHQISTSLQIDINSTLEETGWRPN